jgi:hypothetical protein
VREETAADLLRDESPETKVGLVAAWRGRRGRAAYV